MLCPYDRISWSHNSKYTHKLEVSGLGEMVIWEMEWLIFFLFSLVIPRGLWETQSVCSLWGLYCINQKPNGMVSSYICKVYVCVCVCGMLLWPVSRLREDSVSNPRAWKHSGLVSFWDTHAERNRLLGPARWETFPGTNCCRHRPTHTRTYKNSLSLFLSVSEDFISLYIYFVLREVFDLLDFRLGLYSYRFFWFIFSSSQQRNVKIMSVRGRYRD